MTRNNSDRDEYTDWEPPHGERNSSDGDEIVNEDAPAQGDSSEATELKPPTKLRDPLPRDQIRQRLDVTPQQWYIIETFLLVAPYPVFILIYLMININEMAFLIITLLYSLVAMYIGLLS